MSLLPHIDLSALVEFIGYPGIATIIFLESGVFFGFFLPGASLLFVSGVVAAAGYLNIWILVPLVCIAAILGDNIGYWFGAKIGIKLFSRPNSRFFKQEYVDKTRIFYEKYGTRTILFARFVPIVRTFAPILAGVGDMNYRVFFFYNVIGASLWAGCVTLGGYFIGNHIPNADTYITPIVLIIIVLTCIPLLFQWRKQNGIGRVSHRPAAVIFDIDDTLTESFKPPAPEMLERLQKLLGELPIAIMSATGFPRIESEFLPAFAAHPNKSRLYVFPNSTAQCYLWNGTEWAQQYDIELTEEDKSKIRKAFDESVEETKVLEGVTPKGLQLIDRGPQVAFAALGIDAADEEKKMWDVDKSKRIKLQKAISKRVPEFEVLIGGRTTIDVMQKNINKSYGVKWLSDHLALKPKDMLYVGDALYKGGNDAVVIPTGIKTVSTNGPEETLDIIDDIQSAAAKTGSTKNA